MTSQAVRFHYSSQAKAQLSLNALRIGCPGHYNRLAVSETSGTFSTSYPFAIGFQEGPFINRRTVR